MRHGRRPLRGRNERSTRRNHDLFPQRRVLRRFVYGLFPRVVRPGHRLVRELRARGINTSSQSRTDAPLDFDAKGVEGALRISPHYYNDAEDTATFLDALREILDR